MIRNLFLTPALLTAQLFLQAVALPSSVTASEKPGRPDKEKIAEERPKRGSIELGKGKPVRPESSVLDQINRAFAKVVEEVAPSVVSVNSEKEWSKAEAEPNNPFLEFFGMPPPQNPEQSGPKRNIPLGGGSGFIASKQGHIFTNAHVIEGADIVKVTLFDKRTFTAEVVGLDKKSDVAVLKIKAKPEDLKVISFGDSRNLTIGEWVMAIGNPFTLRNTVTAGIVSAKGRRDQIGSSDSYQDFIQTDAAVNPGNSGGPLVNLKGEVVGINSNIYTRTGGYMGVSFAIPVNMAVKVAEDLIYEGKVIRGYLGVGIDNVAPTLAEVMGLAHAQGCLVREVLGNSPAEKGGLKAGDIILEVEDASVHDAAHLRNLVADLRPHEKYSFRILRDSKKQVLKIKVGAIPEGSETQGDDTLDAPVREDQSGFLSQKLGIRFSKIDADLRRKYGISNETSGVVVVEVTHGSAAAESRLPEGAILLAYKLQDEPKFVNIKGAKELLAVLRDLPSGGKIAFKIRFQDKIDFIALKAGD